MPGAAVSPMVNRSSLASGSIEPRPVSLDTVLTKDRLEEFALASDRRGVRVNHPLLAGLRALQLGDEEQCRDIVEHLRTTGRDRRAAAELALRLALKTYDAATSLEAQAEALDAIYARLAGPDALGGHFPTVFGDEPPATARQQRAVSYPTSIQPGEYREHHFQPRVSSKSGAKGRRRPGEGWDADTYNELIAAVESGGHALLLSTLVQISSGHEIGAAVDVLRACGHILQAGGVQVASLSADLVVKIVAACRMEDETADEALPSWVVHAATLSQLEATASLPWQPQDSISWQTAVVLRIRDQGPNPNLDSDNRMSHWRGLYNRLEAYQMPANCTTFRENLQSAVAASRLVRSWSAALDPQQDPESVQTVLTRLFLDVSNSNRDTLLLTHIDSATAHEIAVGTICHKLLTLMFESMLSADVPVDFFFQPIQPAGIFTRGSAITPLHIIVGDTPAVALSGPLQRFMGTLVRLMRGEADVSAGLLSGPLATVFAEQNAAVWEVLQALQPEQGQERGVEGGDTALTSALDGLTKTWWLRCRTLSALEQRTELAFMSNAAELEGQTAPWATELWIDAANVTEIVINVYEIDLLRYYEEFDREVPDDVALDGLAPSSTARVKDLAASPVQQRVELELPVIGHRGCFVVNATGGGKVCRSIVRRGSLNHIMRVTPAGYAFTVFYEDYSQPGRPGVLFQGRRYTPSPGTGSSQIFIPFPGATTSRNLVLFEEDNGVASLVPNVTLDSESYQLRATVHGEAESLLPGRQSQLYVRAGLTLNGTPVPLTLLENVTLVLSFESSEEGPPLETWYPGVNLQELPLCTELPVRVPPNCHTVSGSLSGRVRKTALGRNHAVQFDTQQIRFSIAIASAADARNEESEDPHRLYLTCVPGGYAVQVLGRCGEPVAALPLVVQLKHWAWKPRKTFNVETDSDGTVLLGCLDGITHMHVCRKREDMADAYMEWRLPGIAMPRDLPERFVIEAGKGNWLSIPYAAVGSEVDESVAHSAALVRRGDTHRPLAVHPLEHSHGCFTVKDLPEGTYTLHIPRLTARITLDVVPAPGELKPDIHMGAALLRPVPAGLEQINVVQPLRISHVQASVDGGVEVHVAGGEGARVVSVAVTRFLPAGLADAAFHVHPGAVENLSWPHPARTQFLDSLEAPSEIQYVLNRRHCSPDEHTPSLLLDKPSLLVDRVAQRTVETQAAPTGTVVTAQARRGTQLKGFPNGPFGARAARYAQRVAPALGMLSAQRPAVREGRVLGFVPDTLFVANCEVGEDGVLRIGPAALVPAAGAAVVTVVAECFGQAPATRVLPLADSAQVQERPCIDLCTLQRIPPGHSAVQTQSVVAALTPPSGPGVTTLPIATTRALHETFLATLPCFSADAGLPAAGPAWAPVVRAVPAAETWREFEFLRDWRELSTPRKLALMASHRCYELQFFVSVTDPEFFEEYVAPTLAARLVLEQDVMMLVLTKNREALRDAMADMAVVAALAPLERLLVGAVLGKEEMLRHLAAEGRAWGERQKDLMRACLTAALQPVMLQPAEPQRTESGDEQSGSDDAVDAPWAPAGASEQGMFGMAATRGMDSELRAEPGSRAAGAVNVEADRMGDWIGAASVTGASSSLFGTGGAFGTATAVQNEDMDTAMEVRERQQAEGMERFSLPQAQEYTEARYWKDARPMTSIITPFWADYAAWLLEPSSTRKPVFLSEHVHAAATDFTSAVLATAVLTTSFQGRTTDLRAPGNAQSSPLQAEVQEPAGLALVRSLCATEVPASAPGKGELTGRVLLVDPVYEREHAESADDSSARTTCWRKGCVFGVRVVVSNLTRHNRAIDVVLPMPEGAVPLGGEAFVKVQRVLCAAFACKEVAARFYWPRAGVFRMPLVTLQQDDRVVAVLHPEFESVQVLDRVDPALVPAPQEGSTEWVLSPSTADDDLLEALQNDRIADAPWDALAWRCRRSKDFFLGLVDVLRARGLYRDSVFRYAVFWKDAPGTRDWLTQNAERLLHALPAPVSSCLLTLREHHMDLRQKEYWPLIYPRVHKFQGQTFHVCGSLEAQWCSFLEFCCRLPELHEVHWLQAAAYLVAMDRVSHAASLLPLAAAAAFPPPDTRVMGPNTMLADYLKAYIALASATPDLAAAKQLIARHHAFPQPDWHTRWRAMSEYCATVTRLRAPEGAGGEAGGDAAAPGEVPAAAGWPVSHGAAEQRRVPFLTVDELEVATGDVTVLCEGAGESGAEDPGLLVRVMQVDLEMLFSSRPFKALSDDIFGMCFVKPTAAVRVPVGPDGVVLLQLLQLFPGVSTSSACIVEVRRRDLCRRLRFFRCAFTVNFEVELGVLTVLQRRGSTEALRRPVAAAYVKVYARTGANEESFWKDGYTDGLGRFPYAASMSPTQAIQDFAVLVVAEGASVHVVAAPSEQRNACV